MAAGLVNNSRTAYLILTRYWSNLNGHMFSSVPAKVKQKFMTQKHCGRPAPLHEGIARTEPGRRKKLLENRR